MACAAASWYCTPDVQSTVRGTLVSRRSVLAACVTLWIASGCHLRPSVPGGPAEWSRVALPGQHDVQVTALGGSGANDVWASLDFATRGGPAVVLYHFDGRSWSRVQTPPELTAPLADIYAVARSDVWAVGGHGEAAHYDGAQWSVLHIPQAEGVDDELTRVCAWPHEAWVTTSMPRGRYYRYRDGVWSVEQSSTRPDATAFPEFWGVTPTDVWFAGAHSQHFNGKGWQVVNVGDATLRDVHGTARNDVWMVGGRGSSLSMYNWRGAAFHWDGFHWTETPVPDGVLFLNRVFAVSRTEAWAVGSGGDAVRWDGSAWRRSLTGVERAPGLPSLSALFAVPGGAAWTGGRAVPGVLAHAAGPTE